jgi:hypothetical protein
MDYCQHMVCFLFDTTLEYKEWPAFRVYEIMPLQLHTEHP